MRSLVIFSVAVNQALVAKKIAFSVPSTHVTRRISIFLRNQGYFSSVALGSDKLLITLRYVNNRAPFRKFLLVSKPSKHIHTSEGLAKEGTFLVSNSDFSLCLKSSTVASGGKVLIQII